MNCERAKTEFFFIIQYYFISDFNDNCFLLLHFRCKVMARKPGYEKIPSDAEKEKVSLFSLLFFQWMNIVFKTGSKRALEQTDFLPLARENTSCFLMEQLQTKWNNEKTKCQKNDRKPKLWKSVIKMLTVKDAMFLISTGVFCTLCRVLRPLILRYLVVSLTAPAESRDNYFLYGCVLAMGITALIGSLSICITLATDVKCWVSELAVP